jgi:tRNA (cytidine/uridine-2'-O-)-methyltransferase
MFHIVLFEPEIAPNTGNIMRLAANAGARLHLVRPLGFVLNDKTLLRAGMDYRDRSRLAVHDDWQACRTALDGKRLFALTTKGETRYDHAAFRADDVFLFGPESRGLPAEVLGLLTPERRLRVPMQGGNRSINLANTVGIVVYEAWRQNAFDGGV